MFFFFFFFYFFFVFLTAGQERFSGLGTAFYRGADACMLVFDVNVEQSFDRLRFWREQFIFHANVESVEDFPFIVIANKTDMPVTERAVSRESLIEFARSNGNLPFVETSA